MRPGHYFFEVWGRGPGGVASGQIDSVRATATADTCTTLPTQENGGRTTTSEPRLIKGTSADQFDVSTKLQLTSTR